MYSVLVPFDRDEERATAQGEAVLQLPDVANSVSVILLHVVQDAEQYQISGVGNPETLSDADATPVSRASRAGPSDPLDLPAGERLHEMLTDAGVEVEVERRTGAPADEILSVAEEFAVDQIVLGGHKRSPLGTLLFGSVTQAVLLDAARPVTTTGTDIKEEPTHRCENCGESYYVDPETEIQECRRCGGTHVETVQPPAQ